MTRMSDEAILKFREDVIERYDYVDYTSDCILTLTEEIIRLRSLYENLQDAEGVSL